MKNFKHLFTALLLLLSVAVNAHDFEVGGIYYKITDESNKTVEVTYKGSLYNEYSYEYTGNVVIPESVTYNGTTYSVTSIGIDAFRDCSGLTSIEIPNSVTRIGYQVFYGCSGLTSIVVEEGNTIYDSRDNCNAIIETSTNTLEVGCKSTVIPTSITSIGDYAFYGCSGLTSVVIPNSVTSIGNNAFRDCSRLASIEIPNSVTSIGNNAFEGTAWYNNQPNGVVYAGNVLYKYKGDMPSNTSIKINEGTSGIAGGAFRDCDGLTSIVIPNSVTNIGGWTFEGCSGLTSIEIPNSVTSIGNAAFEDCSKLTSINISNSVTSIRSWAFKGCYRLTSVVIGNSVTSIEEEAFYGCSGLTSIEIPNSVTSIGSSAFEGTAWYNNQPNGVVYAGNVLYKYKGDMPSNTSIKINEGTLGIADYAFNGCSGLTSIEIPNSVTNIGNSAFYNCSGLTSIVIPNSVTSIGESAFSGTAWYNNQPNGVVYAGNVLYKYKGDMPSNTSIKINEGTLSIAGSAFRYCSGLISIEIPNSVTSIGSSAFYNCSGLKTVINHSSLAITKGSYNYGYVGYYADEVVNTYIHVSSVTLNNSRVTVEKGHTATLSATVSPVDATDKTVMWRTSDEDIVTVDENGVVTAVNVGSATITATAGEFTASCEVVVIETSGSCGENVSWKLAGDILTLYGTGEMQDYAGETPWGWCCETIENIVVEKGITSIGANAFNGCKSVTSIEIPVGVESIGAAAFKNCTALAYISIPNSVKDIANDAFAGCTNLKKVELNTTTVENWFSGYTSIKEIVTGNSVTSIVGGAFSGCTNLASLTVGSKVASFGTNAFNGCGNIIKVFWLGNTPPAGYEQLSGKINYVANNQYTNLSGEVVVSQFLSSKFEIDGTVYVPTSLSDRTCCIVDYDILSDVSDVAIEETVSYQGVSLKVQDINPYSFYGKENLSTVTFAHNGGIGTSAFEGCTSLAAIEIPNTVTFVGDHAFRNCTKLTAAKINDRETVLPLGMQLFANTAIESLYIDSKISYDESDREISPFSESSTLKSVVITNAESNIYDYEFYNCTALESAVVGDGVEKIGRWAFSGCLNLKDFVFGSNLEEIGEEAFSDCSGLVQITGRAVLPPVCGDQALDDINKWTCKLYVPAVNLDAYQEADQWKEFIFVEELVTTDNYVTYKIDGEVYKILLIKPGERIITPTVDEKEGYTFSGWDLSEYISADGYPVMPAEDIVVEASFYITGIDEVKTEPTVDASQNEKVKTVYDLNGRRIVDAEYLEHGVYIVNGKKILVKY